MALNHPVYDALKNTNVILASTSERRKEILDKLGINYVAVGSNFAEDLDKEALGPSEYVIQTATHKGIAVVQNLLSQQHSVPDTNTTLVISADTIVEAEGKVYEKPRSKQHQFETLKHLKDNRLLIEVKTAVIAFVIPGDAKSKPQKQQQQQQYQGLDARAEGNAQNLLSSLGIATSTHLECTKVYMDFDNITDSFLQSYVDSGEGSGAAGGFKIQGIGGLLFKEIEGDYCNVVGLPFTSTFRLIEKALLG